MSFYQSYSPAVLVLLAFAGVWLFLLAHEAAHFWAIKAVGARPVTMQVGLLKVAQWERKGVTYRLGLLPLYGYVSMVADRVSPRETLLVAVAGPLANLVLTLAFLVPGLALHDVALLWAAGINLNLVLFNLLPIPGLDGWVIVDSFVQRLGGRIPSTIRKFAGVAGAVGLGIYFLAR